MLNPVIISKNYDYIGVYLTDKCHLKCPYCITLHYRSTFGNHNTDYLTAGQWIEGLNRLDLPADVPITLQGGEPFLYKDIWEILENTRHKIDILTALPPFIKKEDFFRLGSLEWNRRVSPYPTIRVSYHKGQNDYRKLIERIAEFQEILSIGLYYLEYPLHNEEEIAEIKKYAAKFNIELRSKEFLGEYEGKIYGSYLYPEAVSGERQDKKVLCRNTVVPIAPDGTIYRCHSDLYFNRKELALGNILDNSLHFPEGHLDCDNYGLCSGCDVKVKTNHYQQHGYTSANIKFPGGQI